MHIVVINPSDGKVERSKVFDTYESSNEFDDFITDDIPLGCIVIAACKDECVTQLSTLGK